MWQKWRICFPFHKETKVQILSLDRPPPSSPLSLVKGFFNPMLCKGNDILLPQSHLTKIFKLCVNISTTELLACYMVMIPTDKIVLQTSNSHLHAKWLFSRNWLFATLWTVIHQALLSMEFSRQEYQSGLPCLLPGDLPNQHRDQISVSYISCMVGSLPLAPRGKPKSWPILRYKSWHLQIVLEN